MSPRGPQHNKALREESHTKIVASALALFAKNGYEQTSIRTIAQHAGISQGLMYNYFSSKEALLQVIALRGLNDVRSSLSIPDDIEDPRQQLASAINQSFAAVRGNLQFWQLFYSVRSQPAVLAGLSQDVTDWTEFILETLEDRLATAAVANPAIEARVLFALIDGAAQHYALDATAYPLDAVAAAIVARYERHDGTQTGDHQ